MKISPFLSVLAGSGQAEPLEFWRESNLFAYQVRESIHKNGLANRFIKKYDEVRDVMRWIQDEGVCNSDVSSPSYEPVSFDAVFDAKASPGANIDALTDSLERWIQSYACIEDQEAYEKFEQALFDIKKIAKKNINRDKHVSFHISEDEMTYDQARAYCFSKDMWLADPQDLGQLQGVLKSMTVNNDAWFDSWQATEGECWVQKYWSGKTINGELIRGKNDEPADCENKYYAACQTGQIQEKECTAWPTAPIRTNEQSQAQEYCEYVGGNLPFFNNKKELAEWQNRPDPDREWLGIVRNEEFESGWAKVTGEEATVFAWAAGEPDFANDNEFCATTMINGGGVDYNNPFVWNDVPCSWATEIFRCRIDSTVYVWEDCPVPEFPEPPKPGSFALYSASYSYEENRNFLLSLDGEKIDDLPSAGFRFEALHAIIRGTVYIFGGWEKSSGAEYNKVSKLLGNEFEDVPITLPMRARSSGQSMAINGNSEALICSSGTCLFFDEESLSSAPSYLFYHSHGCMAEYKGNPAVVASSYEDRGKPETLIDGNWVALPPPADSSVVEVYLSACFGLDDGSFLKAGGRPTGSTYDRAIWLLREGAWSKIGDLPENFATYNKMRIGNYYYMAAGTHTGNKIFRMEIEDNTIISTKSIYEDYSAWGMLIPN